MAGQFFNAPSPSRREARNFENELDIVIVGNKSDKNVTSGQYVTVRDSAISGITNGIYKATANVAAGTAFVAANLDAVTSGALNDLSGNLADKTAVSKITSNKTGLSGYRFGRVAVITGTNIAHSSAISTDTKIATVSVSANQQAFGYGKTLTTKDDVFVFVNTGGDVYVSGLTPLAANATFYFTIVYITAS